MDTSRSRPANYWRSRAINGISRPRAVTGAWNGAHTTSPATPLVLCRNMPASATRHRPRHHDHRRALAGMGEYSSPHRPGTADSSDTCTYVVRPCFSMIAYQCHHVAWRPVSSPVAGRRRPHMRMPGSCIYRCHGIPCPKTPGENRAGYTGIRVCCARRCSIHYRYPVPFDYRGERTALCPWGPRPGGWGCPAHPYRRAQHMWNQERHADSVKARVAYVESVANSVAAWFMW